MYKKQIAGVWLLSLIEAVVYAIIPAFVAGVATGEQSFVSLAFVCLTGITIVIIRNMLDTRVYGAFYRDKLIELALTDRSSARAKAERWLTAITALESSGPMILRGCADVGVAVLYITSVATPLGGLLLIGAVPYLGITFWAAHRMQRLAAQKNQLALQEAGVYNNTDLAITKYYGQKYKLHVAESDVDATSLGLGMGTMYLVKVLVVVLVLRYEQPAAVAVAAFFYAERFANGIDRLSIAVQKGVAALVASKV